MDHERAMLLKVQVESTPTGMALLLTIAIPLASVPLYCVGGGGGGLCGVAMTLIHWGATPVVILYFSSV